MYPNGQRMAHAAPTRGQQRPSRPFVMQHEIGGQAKLTTTLVHAVSDATGADVSAVETALHERVDPDALDLLFAPAAGGNQRSNATLTMTIGGHQVTVSNTGRITVSPSRPSLQR